MSLAKFQYALRTAFSSQEINSCLSDYLYKQGIHNFVVTCYLKKGQYDRVVEYDYLSDTMQSWHQHYHNQGYDELDSTSRKVKRNALPVYWTIEEQLKQSQSQAEKSMRLESMGYGIERGLTIPMCLTGGEQAILMIALMSGDAIPDRWFDLQYELFSMAHYYYFYLKESLFKEQEPLIHCYNLNARQLQCLQLTAKQYSVSDIAVKLAISERTVNYHLQKLNKRLGTTNKHMSVAKAQREKLIE